MEKSLLISAIPWWRCMVSVITKNVVRFRCYVSLSSIRNLIKTWIDQFFDEILKKLLCPETDQSIGKRKIPKHVNVSAKNMNIFR